MATTNNLFSVRDRVVVLTGGLGQLGRCFATGLADRGARVAIFDLACDRDTVRARFEKQAQNENLMFLSADVTKRDSLTAALERVVSHWGAPHALIANAALDSPPSAQAEENGPFETYPEDSWDRIMEANAKGVFLSCQVVGGAMAAKGRGCVINIASIYGFVSPDQRIYEYRRQRGEIFFKPVAYSASKSALYNLTRYLATYWAPRHVRVNTLTFGGVFNQQEPDFLDAYCARVPLGRMAEPEDYLGAVLFLVSDASSYMTGSNLVIDGGWTAW